MNDTAMEEPINSNGQKNREVEGKKTSAFEIARRAVDKVAIGAIKVLSLFAVIILVVIIGYISVRAFVSEKHYDTVVIPQTSSEGIPLALLVHKKTEIQSLSYPVLKDLFDGKTFSLRKISSIDRDVMLYIESNLEQTVKTYLGIDSKGLARSQAQSVSSTQLISLMENNKGAIALVSPEFAEQVHSSKIQIVPIEDMVLAVHPSVTELIANIRLISIDQDDVEGLLGGRFSSWKELGGQDLAVKVLDDSRQIPKVRGSVMPVTYQYAQDENLTTLDVNAYVRTGNLDVAYLVEKPVDSGKYGGISTIIGNTLLMVLVTVLIAAPLGVGAAAFLVEYPKNNKLLSVIRTGVDLLAGVPSIIFGLFGLLVFVQLAGWSFSLISGALTISIMILPTIVRTSEEAIRSVDRSLREASIALGATRVETIWKVVIPSATPGITTGIILAIGRAVGETAALIYTIGSSTDLATGPLDSARVLAMHIFLTITEGQSLDRAFASAFVLVVLVLFINIFARFAVGRLFSHGSH